MNLKSNQNSEPNNDGKYLLIVLIYPLVWVVGQCTKSKIGLFPFEAEVWGNFADHVMILVTVGSVYLLYRSINHQVEAIKQQTNALNLQTRDYKLRELEIRNKFNLQYEIEFHVTETGEYFEFNFINKGNTIKEISFSPMNKVVVLEKVYDNEDNLIGFSKIEKPRIRLWSDLENNHTVGVVFENIEESQLVKVNLKDGYNLKYSITFLLYPNYTYTSWSLKYED